MTTHDLADIISKNQFKIDKNKKYDDKSLVGDYITYEEIFELAIDSGADECNRRNEYYEIQCSNSKITKICTVVFKLFYLRDYA